MNIRTIREILFFFYQQQEDYEPNTSEGMLAHTYIREKIGYWNRELVKEEERLFLLNLHDRLSIQDVTPSPEKKNEK